MAVKTFVSGETLTASDTNTYLNNGGLVYVTSLAISASATAQINNCFTSTHDSYRVILTTTALSSNPNFYFQFSKSGTPTAGTGYNWSSWYVTTALANGAVGGLNAASVNPAFGSSAIPEGTQIVDISFPAAARRTVFLFNDERNDTAGYVWRSGGGIHNDTTSHDGIRFTVSAGTMTGTLIVYGYRQA